MATTPIITAVAAGERSWMDGGAHSVMYFVIPPTANGERSSLGPAGVIAVTNRLETGMASIFSVIRPRIRPSSVSPTTTTAPTTIPLNHIPCEQAQSQETGMSHH